MKAFQQLKKKNLMNINYVDVTEHCIVFFVFLTNRPPAGQPPYAVLTHGVRASD